MALDQPMVSMKRSKEDKRGDKMEHASIESIEPDYPYGLCIHMDGDEMDKLDIKTMPKVGDEMILVCKVKATRCSQMASEYTNGNDERSIDLQITEIGWEEEA